MPTRSRRPCLAPSVLSLSVAACLAAVGCGHKNDGAAADSGECVTTRQFFERNVWSAFMSQTCTKCHLPDGEAPAKGAKLVLQPTSYPGWLDANIAMLKNISQIQYNGTSEILVKPIGGAQHVGGQVLDPNGPQIAALKKLVQLFATGDQCAPQPSTALDGVVVLDEAATFRKAAIDLGGRLPTDAEIASISADKQGSTTNLDAALDQLLTEDTFYVRLKEIWNDSFLTDKLLAYNGAALDALDTDKDWPGALQFKDSSQPGYSDEAHYQANRAIAQEPLDLIAYVVRNERPFTEIVTANYTVVNPYSAAVYGVTGQVQFSNPNDPTEFHEAQVTEGNGNAIPHAGILSTPAWLNRWNTTPTNRNRGRARRVFKYLLATDVLKIATRPVDATAVTQEDNPTREDPQCVVCHSVVDPVAGTFRGWDDYNYDDFDPSRPWHDEMFPPGFGNTMMTPDYYTHAVQFLGAQIAQDPRFAINAVYVMYKGLTGHDPLEFPSDPTASTYNDAVAAWEAQDAFFQATLKDFQNANMNLKVVVKDIIKSQYYRASGIGRDPGADASTLLDGVGTGRLLTPEMLNRKIIAVTGGIHWREQGDWDNPHDWLTEDYNSYKIAYGGIDSDTVPVRLTTINGVAASVARRMANEMACHTTAYDFSRSKDQRRWFPFVDPMEVPESAGHTVDGSVSDIKTNIQYLHKLILGEDLDVTDPEIERTYNVFLDTWHELSQASMPTTDLDWECQARIDPTNGMDLPDAQKISKDPTFTIRSWQAVINYLLLDYKFLYE